MLRLLSASISVARSSITLKKPPSGLDLGHDTSAIEVVGELVYRNPVCSLILLLRLRFKSPS
jgi:hypothetical protein